MRLPVSAMLALTLAGLTGARSVAAQGGLETLGGLGQLVGSFFAHTAYVGSVEVSIRKLGARRPRVQLHGFSVALPSGAEWYMASSNALTATTVQTVWFVKDPHRFTAWAKRAHIAAHPTSLIARLQFYGGAAASDFASLVRTKKTAEYTTAGVRVLSVETRLVPIAELQCAEYEGRVIDRRAPVGFVEQPFLESVGGRVCAHPDAPWLAVDIGFARRSPEATPSPPDPAERAFIESLGFEPFQGPVIEDLLLMGPEGRSRGSHRAAAIEALAVRDGTLWVLHRPAREKAAGGSATGTSAESAAGAPASRLLSRFDRGSNLVTEIRVEDRQVDPAASGTQAAAAPSVGTAGRAVWVIAGHRVVRVDASTNAALEEVAVRCPPGLVPAYFPLRAGNFGVWLACRTRVTGKKGSSRESPGALRRLDRALPAADADIALPATPGRMHGDSRRAWVSDAESSPRKQCRVHEIDVGATRLVRTVVLGSFECSAVAVAGDDAWLIRGPMDRAKVLKVDLQTGRILATIPLARGRYVTELAVGRDTVWVSMGAGWDSPPRTGDFGSTGVLVTIDRAAGHVKRTVPTGVTSRLIAVEDDTAWLYDWDGAIVRVRDPRRLP
jgi:hypothetical protein